MKLRIYFSFHVKEGSISKIKEFLIKHGKKEIAKKRTQYPTFNIFSLDSMDHLIPQMRGELKKYTTDWGERVDYEFNKEELQSCTLLDFGSNKYPKAYAGPETGTKYDLSCACKKCGSGAIQVGPLLVRPSDLKKLDIQNTYLKHVIISKKLRDVFIREKLKGVEFREVVSKANKKGLGFYQIIPQVILPPALSSSFEKENQCPVCKRDGHFDLHTEGEPYMMKYKIDESILKKNDMFYTYEIYGVSMLKEPFEESVLSQPKIIISSRVHKIVSKLKINEVGFSPVIVNNHPPMEKWKEDLNNERP